MQYVAAVSAALTACIPHPPDHAYQLLSSVRGARS
jgi:hypothetical protein